jgi:hypothetical protein
VCFEFVALLCHIDYDLALIAHKSVEALLVIVGDREGAKKRADLFLQDGERHTMRRAGAALASAIAVEPWSPARRLDMECGAAVVASTRFTSNLA